MRNARSDGEESLDVNSSKHIVRLLFSSEMCVVSDAASQLMHLVHKTLEVALLGLGNSTLDLCRHGWDNKLIFPTGCLRVFCKGCFRVLPRCSRLYTFI